MMPTSILRPTLSSDSLSEPRKPLASLVLKNAALPAKLNTPLTASSTPMPSSEKLTGSLSFQETLRPSTDTPAGNDSCSLTEPLSPTQARPSFSTPKPMRVICSGKPLSGPLLACATSSQPPSMATWPRVSMDRPLNSTAGNSNDEMASLTRPDSANDGGASPPAWNSMRLTSNLNTPSISADRM